MTEHQKVLGWFTLGVGIALVLVWVAVYQEAAKDELHLWVAGGEVVIPGEPGMAAFMFYAAIAATISGLVSLVLAWRR